MPDFQNDGFALFDRQFGQTTHGRAFLRRFPWRTLEPAARFQFAREPAPQTAVIVQRAVAKAADTITIGLRGRLAPLQQRHERLLQNILRFAVAQPQRPAVENQLRGFRFVKGFAPICLGTHISSLNRHQSGRICIKNLARNRLFSWLDCTTPRYSAALWNRKPVALVLLLVLVLDRSISDYENEDDHEDERFARPATSWTDTQNAQAEQAVVGVEHQEHVVSEIERFEPALNPSPATARLDK